MQLSNVCRLCLKEDNLIWVFDKRFENGGMKDVVYITTGVEINTNDIISQKICAKCSELTIRMFDFRKTAQRSDNHLKERSKQYLKTNNLANLPTEVKIKKEKVDPELDHPEAKPAPKVEVKPKPPKIRLHPSIRELYKKYSGIRLPDICLNSDYAPTVCLQMNAVERYFKRRNLDFDYYVKAALKPAKRVATKRTSAANKPKPKSHKSHKTGDNRLVDVKINRDNSTNKISIKFLKNTHHQNELSPESTNTNKDDPKPSTSRDWEPERKLDQVKRKSSESEKSEIREIKKPAFVESLGLITKPNVAEDPAYVANVSTPLHICQICNSVQYNAKDLRKHQNKHLRCQFCKTRFRSLETKKEHLNKSCKIKNAMNNLPDVVLKRINENQHIRKKYPDAFKDFPGLNNNVINALAANPNEEAVNSENAEKPKVVTAPPIDIIEIDSDEEDSAPSPATKKLAEAPNSVGSNAPKDNNNENISNPSIPQRLLPIPDNVVYNTVSIVKPDVRIKDNPLLDNIDSKISDMILLKHLLVNYKRMQLTANQSNQTDPPSNDSIVLNGDGTAELKDLKKQLYAYKIPVTIKNGPLNVSYESTVREPRSRKLHLWRNLTPVDVKVCDVNAPNSVSAPVVRESEKQGSDVNNTKAASVGLPPTVTYNASSSLSFVPNNSSMSTATAQPLPTNSYVYNPALKGYSPAKSNIPATITSSTVNSVNSNPALYQPAATVNISVPFSLLTTTSSVNVPSNNMPPGNCVVSTPAQPQLFLNNASNNLLLSNSCVIPTPAPVPQFSVNNTPNNVLISNSCIVPTPAQEISSLGNPSNTVVLGNTYVVPTSVQSHSSINTSNMLLGNSCTLPTPAQPNLSLNNALLDNGRIVPTSGHVSLNNTSNMSLGKSETLALPTLAQPHSSLNKTSNAVQVGNSARSSAPTFGNALKKLAHRKLSTPTATQNLQSLVRGTPPNVNINNSPALPPNPSVSYPHSSATMATQTLQSLVRVTQPNVYPIHDPVVPPKPTVSYPRSSSSVVASGSSLSTNNVLPGPSSIEQSSPGSSIAVGSIRVRNVWELT